MDVAFKLEVLKAVKESSQKLQTIDKYGISRATYYKWKRIYEAGTESGLQDLRGGPYRAIPDDIKERIIEYAKTYPSRNTDCMGYVFSLHPKTVHTILKAAKLQTYALRYDYLKSQKESISDRQRYFIEDYELTLEVNRASR